MTADRLAEVMEEIAAIADPCSISTGAEYKRRATKALKALADHRAQAPAEGDVWALIERYAAAKVDCATNPTHESAKAYAKLAESNLRDALAANPQPKGGDKASEWRKLAQQFDGQRMAAMVHLRTLLALPDTHAEAVRAFLAATPAEQIASVALAQATAPAPEVPPENLPTKEHIRELAQEALDQIMGQAQVFASAWSLVGGKFDDGNALSDAEEAKDELRTMVRSLADLAAETVRPGPCAAVGAEGMALVPVTPTKAMVDAGRWSEYGEETSRLHDVEDDDVLAVWGRMLDAAQKEVR